MTCALMSLGAAGWSESDGKLGPHKRPISEDLDLLNFACSVKLWGVLVGLSPRGGSEIGLMHDRLARQEKDYIIRHQR